MTGRRIPVGPDSVELLDVLRRPGDYYGPVSCYTNGVPAVFFYLPVTYPDDSVVFGHVQSPPHVFTEEPDGSLTIRESILTRFDFGERTLSWHGYLTKGVWAEC